MIEYDFGDPKIRYMVNRHHPEERFLGIGGPVDRVACDTCYQTWPCPPVQALRQWQVDNGNPADYDG